jgi:hypothetical protein
VREARERRDRRPEEMLARLDDRLMKASSAPCGRWRAEDVVREGHRPDLSMYPTPSLGDGCSRGRERRQGMSATDLPWTSRRSLRALAGRTNEVGRERSATDLRRRSLAGHPRNPARGRGASELVARAPRPDRRACADHGGRSRATSEKLLDGGDVGVGLEQTDREPELRGGLGDTSPLPAVSAACDRACSLHGVCSGRMARALRGAEPASE